MNTTPLFAILFPWLPNCRGLQAGWLAFALFLIYGYTSTHLTTAAIGALLGFACVLRQLNQSGRMKLLWGGAAFFYCVALMLNRFPGFTHISVFHRIQLTPDAIPYSWSLNPAALLASMLIILLTHPVIKSVSELKKILRVTAPIVLLCLICTIPTAFVLGYVKFEPKLPAIILEWSLCNLAITCVAEEAIFRGLLQKTIRHTLKSFRFCTPIAIFLSASIFGFAHIAGGLKYVVLATVAGLFYGTAYAKTERLEASILTHFSLNLVHFLFFTYPALIPA